MAVGDTVAECEQAYVQLLAREGALSEEQVAQVVATTQTKGVIETITQAVVDGNSHFYVTLEGDGAIYDFALPTMLPIVTYQAGDTVEFGYAEGEQANVVTNFEDIDAVGSVFAGDAAAEEDDPDGSQDTAATDAA